MWYFDGHSAAGLIGVEWIYRSEPHEAEGVTLRVKIGNDWGQGLRGKACQTAKHFIQRHGITWLIPNRREWVIDLDGAKQKLPKVGDLDWFKGKIVMEPDFEWRDLTRSPGRVFHGTPHNRIDLVLTITPDTLRAAMPTFEIPVEIRDSLDRFRTDYPDASKTAFILMKFGCTTGHEKIVAAIRKTLQPHGIEGLRADDKQYHDDLLPNVQTYLYGCGFGIAVFERLLSNEFNPNVSLEVGCLMTLRKDICFLKDETLDSLQTDLVGRLYRPFDPQEPGKTIPTQLEAWMRDKEIIARK